MNRKRVLLDTNIIIYREANRVFNYSVGNLYSWIEKMGYIKLIHPLTIKEIEQYKDKDVQEIFKIKLDSYQKLSSSEVVNEEFKIKINEHSANEHDLIDNQLLFNTYIGNVDFLITEDKKMLRKAERLGIRDRVLAIGDFISLATRLNPELVDYKVLAVEKIRMGMINLSDKFFDSLREDYGKDNFNQWFRKKCDEFAYICRDKKDELLGFLYLKEEGVDEYYGDITPAFAPKNRLKVGTFKTVATGFRLGERFIKIILDNAKIRKVDKVYVTLFDTREEQTALKELLHKWGFFEYGVKGESKEIVLVKMMKKYDTTLSVKENFPNISSDVNIFYLPILAKYHTDLLPDLKIKTEKDRYIDQLAHRYALEKVYISFFYGKLDYRQGDILLIYRMGDIEPKHYSSVLTGIGIVENVFCDFKNIEDYLSCCQNRSIFSEDELINFWNRSLRNNTKLQVIKFIHLRSFEHKPTLAYLREQGFIGPCSGPRQNDKATKEQMKCILDYVDNN